MRELTIGGLAREGGVGVETVRYYQRRGLVGVPERSDRGVRRYGEPDVRRLRFIRSAQGAGFTLEQIGELIVLESTVDCARARDIAIERIRALDAKIAQLKAARDALSLLAQECAGSARLCPIITAFEPAAMPTKDRR